MVMWQDKKANKDKDPCNNHAVQDGARKRMSSHITIMGLGMALSLTRSREPQENSSCDDEAEKKNHGCGLTNFPVKELASCMRAQLGTYFVPPYNL